MRKADMGRAVEVVAAAKEGSSPMSLGRLGWQEVRRGVVDRLLVIGRSREQFSEAATALVRLGFVQPS